MVVLAVCTVVGLIARRGGRAVPVEPPVLDDATVRRVTELVARDRPVEAIKTLRQATGLGLREAKEWVDAWEPGNPSAPPSTAPTTQQVDPELMQVLAVEARGVRAASGEIAAIKHVRARTGWGLGDAKAYVDRL